MLMMVAKGIREDIYHVINRHAKSNIWKNMKSI